LEPILTEQLAQDIREDDFPVRPGPMTKKKTCSVVSPVKQ
jgi:hypothetical protein